jgi:hypothetical protein
LSDKKTEQQQDPFEVRKRLTFEQAEGAEPLPAQLKPKEVSPAMRATIWALVLKSVEGSTHRGGGYGAAYVGDPWRLILTDQHVHRQHRMLDEFTNSYRTLRDQLKQIFASGDYLQIFGFLQFVIRHPKCPYRFADLIDGELKSARAAYRVMDYTIVPIGSDAEQATLQRAFNDLAATEFHGARKHLRTAAEELTAGHADSIRESIHAVESVVRILEPDGEFSRALAKLESKATIHGAMKIGFKALYGFTSDENGIRHPLLEKDSAAVDETDALFMIGACAAFVSYLANKARTGGLLAAKRGTPAVLSEASAPAALAAPSAVPATVKQAVPPSGQPRTTREPLYLVPRPIRECII